MKYVTVPPLLVIPEFAPAMTYAFSRYIRRDLVNHPDVMQDDATIAMMLDLADQAKDLAPGMVWGLTDEQHAFLTTLARTFNYSPDVKLYFLRYVRAFTAAVTKDPSTP